MILLNPKAYAWESLDPNTRQLMLETIAFFEAKGKASLKHDDHERVWYADFLGFCERARSLRHADDPRWLWGS